MYTNSPLQSIYTIYKFYYFEINILSYVILASENIVSFENISNNTTHDMVLKYEIRIIAKIQYKTFFTFSISSSEKVVFCIYGVLSWHGRNVRLPLPTYSRFYVFLLLFCLLTLYLEFVCPIGLFSNASLQQILA